MSEHSISRRRFEQGVLVFDYGESTIRCGGTADKQWFVAKDVCDALGIAWRGNTLDAIKPEWRAMRKLRIARRNPDGSTSFQQQDVVVITEAAVYKLAFRSNKPEADAFTNWVAEEVLPSIRKTGAYQAKRRQRYQQMGLAPEWIENREQGIVARKQFTDTLQEHGVTEGRDYGRITNTLYGSSD